MQFKAILLQCLWILIGPILAEILWTCATIASRGLTQVLYGINTQMEDEKTITTVKGNDLEKRQSNTQFSLGRASSPFPLNVLSVSSKLSGLLQY